MTDARQLKPCPFCGEKEEIYLEYENLGRGPCVGIDCLGCGIDFKPRKGADVIAAWNRRADATEAGKAA